MSGFISRIPPSETKTKTPVQENVNEDVLKVFATSYSTALVEAGKQARDRANSGWTVASAIATAVVATGLLAGVKDATDLTKILTGLALASWLGAAWSFLLAVTESSSLGKDFAWTGPKEFIEKVSQKGSEESGEIKGQTRQATNLVLVAIGLTTAAFLSGVLWPPAADPKPTVSVLSVHAQGLLPPNCTAGSTISGTLSKREESLVQIKVTDPVCAKDVSLLISLPEGAGLAIK